MGQDICFSAPWPEVAIAASVPEGVVPGVRLVGNLYVTDSGNEIIRKITF